MEKQKKKLNGKKIWLLVIIISIMCIPAFYGFMYLKTYWNNGTAINKVPIAVVNLDKPYEKSGQTYDIGNTVENNLKNNTALDWKFVSYKEAKDGLYGTKYYAMIVIPKDFSKDIANASTDGFKKPEIEFYQNQGKNYVFSEVSSIGVDNVRKNVAESISKSVSKALVQTIYKTKDGFKVAANGANALNNGIGELEKGSTSLNSGINKLQSGSDKLGSGANTLQNGSEKLASGVTQLASGASSLENGEEKLSNGAKALQSGVGELSGGIQGLNEGLGKLQDGSTALSSGINKLQNGSSNLEGGINKLQDGAVALSNGMDKLQTGASKIQAGQEGITEELTEVTTLLKNGNVKEATALEEKITEQSKEISQKMAELKSGVKTANEGALKVSEGAGAALDGAKALNSGISNAESGADELNKGIISAHNGASKLSDGASKVENGTSALNTGIGTLKDGTGKLTTGLNGARVGANDLSGGATQLANGINTLSTGLEAANQGGNKLNSGLLSASNGANKLSAGLNDGYKNLNDNLTFTADSMSSFISNPVVLKTVAINKVASYGEGFAPYFMCIALWVGAMYAYYLISAMSRRFEGSFKKRFIKMYLIGISLCVLQALVMSIVVYYGLGIKSNTIGWFYGVNVITAIAIFSFMNGLHYIITSIMKGALTVLMVVQFTTCGGAYPINVLPAAFKAISPFTILYHSVNAMRMSINGINYSVFKDNLSILIMFIIVSVVIGFLVGYYRNYITHKRVMKEKSELIAENETFNQYV